MSINQDTAVPSRVVTPWGDSAEHISGARVCAINIITFKRVLQGVPRRKCSGGAVDALGGDGVPLDGRPLARPLGVVLVPLEEAAVTTVVEEARLVSAYRGGRRTFTSGRSRVRRHTPQEKNRRARWWWRRWRRWRCWWWWWWWSSGGGGGGGVVAVVVVVVE